MMENSVELRGLCIVFILFCSPFSSKTEIFVDSDPNAPTCPPDSYPRNPAYGNMYNTDNPAPIALPPSGGGGDSFLTGAAVGYVGAHHGIPGAGAIHGAMAPELYNPMSGGYDMV